MPVDRYAYTGREWDDALGLQYSRVRMYDSSIGRWISEDPIGFDALDPNLQRYVGNGPTNGVDPSGLFTPPVIYVVAVATGRYFAMRYLQQHVAFTALATATAAEELLEHSQYSPGPNASFVGRECLNARTRPSTNYDFQLSLQPKTDPLASPEAVLEAIKIEQQEAARRKKKDKPCFPAGTPIRTPDGYQNIEDLRAGDLVLSRDEADQDGPVLAQRIEEVFTRHGLVWSLHVGGQVIQTTAEHPFYVKGRGWVRCDGLQVGDLLMTELGHWLPVEDLLDTGEWMALYNFRVAEFHTYFVGTEEWGFSVWTHNTCFYRIGGRSPANLEMKPAEEKLKPPGISVIIGGTPQAAVAEMRAAAAGWPPTAAIQGQLFPVGSSIVAEGDATNAAITALGFSIIPAPTKKLPNHGRLVHKDGVAGFTPANLALLSALLTDHTGL